MVSNRASRLHLNRLRALPVKHDVVLTWAPSELAEHLAKSSNLTDLTCAMILSWSAPAALHSLLLRYSLLTCFPYTNLAIILPSSNLINNDDDTNWATAIRQGTSLFHYLETGCYPDVPDPLSMDDLKARGWEIGNPYSGYWPPEFTRFDKGSNYIGGEVFDHFGWRDPEEGAFWYSDLRRDC